jgi:peptidoglycan/LPS O-acetylase OafA/YrhL
LDNVSNSHKSFPIPALDGVRALACLFVVFCHAGYAHFNPSIVGLGTFGVMLFFTLSGFLMAYHYLPEQFSIIYWARFFGHRFVRVYPPFFFATFGYLIIQAHLPHGFPQIHEKGVQGLIPSWILKENKGVFWTIPVEIEFYLIYPLIAWIVIRAKLERLFLFVTLLGILLFFLYMGKNNVWALMVFSFFICGVLSGSVLKFYKSDTISPVYWEIAAILSLLAFYCCINQFPPGKRIWLNFWFYGPLMAFAILSIAQSKGIIYWLFGNPLSRFIGQISYSLYLMHFFVISILSRSMPQISFIVLIPILCIGWLYYVLIELPSLKLAKQIFIRSKHVQ